MISGGVAADRAGDGEDFAAQIQARHDFRQFTLPHDLPELLTTLTGILSNALPEN